MNDFPKFRKSLWALCGMTVLLIVWGALVRSTGSGLGCPDWPLCHGEIIPPFEKEVLIEYFHRLLATLVGLGTLVIAVTVWCKKELRKNFLFLSVLAVVLLSAQVVLGGVTVKTELHPHIVATHLALALLFLAVIFYMSLRLAHDPDRTIARSHDRTVWYRLSHITLALLFFQIVLGGLVAASNAGLACPDFPTCQGVWWPSLKGLVGLHFIHRLGALLVFGMIVGLTVSFRILKGRKCPFSFRAVFTLVSIQLLLGIGSVMMGLPLWMRLAHNAVAVFLFLGLMKATYELHRS